MKKAMKMLAFLAMACIVQSGGALLTSAEGADKIVDDFEGYSIGGSADDSLLRTPDVRAEFVPSVTGEGNVSLKFTTDNVSDWKSVGIRPKEWDWTGYAAVQCYIEGITAEGETGFAIKPSFEEGGPDWEWYLLSQMSPVYYKAAGESGWTETLVGEGYTIWLPSDFKGYIQIPLENFVWVSGKGDYAYDLANVYSFCMEMGPLGPNHPFYIDDLTLVKEVAKPNQTTTSPDPTTTASQETEPSASGTTESAPSVTSKTSGTDSSAVGGQKPQGKSLSPVIIVILVVVVIGAAVGGALIIRRLITQKKEK